MGVIDERISADGKTSFRARVRLKGYPQQVATFPRKTDAKKWIQDTESSIREGRHFKTSEAKKHTFGEMIDRYLRDELPKRRKGKDKQEALITFWKNTLGPYCLADVSTAMISEYRDRLLKENTYRGTLRSPSTVVRYLAALSHVYSVAVKEWEWIDSNPVSRVRKPTEPQIRVRFLSDKEREDLLSACKESDSPYLYLVVIVAISTGMRSSEIMNLTWDDVDMLRMQLVLNDTKNKQRRAVPIVGLAHGLLKDLYKVRRIDSKFLFPSSDPKKPVELRKPWEIALKKAGIENFRFHDLRHTAASYLAMNGATLAEIAEVLGHKTLAMVKRYAHLSDAHTANVVLRMNEKIFGGENENV